MWFFIAIFNSLFVGSWALGQGKLCGPKGKEGNFSSLIQTIIAAAEKGYLKNDATCTKELTNRRAYVKQNQVNLSVCRNLLVTASPQDLQDPESNVGSRFKEKDCKTLLSYNDSLISLNNECSLLRAAEEAKKTPKSAIGEVENNSARERPAPRSPMEKKNFINKYCGEFLGKNVRASTDNKIYATAKMNLTRAKIEELVKSEESFSKFISDLNFAGGDNSKIEKICLQYASDDVI